MAFEIQENRRIQEVSLITKSTDSLNSASNCCSRVGLMPCLLKMCPDIDR